MILTDVGLRQSLEQLQSMYLVLGDLRSRMAADPSKLRLFAEGPIEEIRRLRRDIDDYLGFPELAEHDNESADTAASRVA